MSYVTRNANIVLLFLVVITVTVLVGATVYYQSNFGSLTSKYQEKVSVLDETKRELKAKQDTLEEIYSELDIKREREEEFTEQYTEVKSTKEKLETQTEKLQKTKKELEDALQQATKDKLEAEKTLQFEKAKVQDLEEERDELKLDLRNEERISRQRAEQIQSLQSQLEDCQSQ